MSELVLPIVEVYESVGGHGFGLIVRYQHVAQVGRKLEHVSGQLYLKIVLEYKYLQREGSKKAPHSITEYSMKSVK